MTTSGDCRAHFPPVRNQGSRLTCLAFALSDTHSAIRKSGGHFSTEYLYYHGVQRMPTKNPSEGLTMTAGTDALRHDGQPAEADWAYLPALPNPLSGWVPPKGKALYHAVGSIPKPSPAEIRRQLDAGIPTVLGVRISRAFIAADDQGILPVLPLDSNCGGHAMVAVGHGEIHGKPATLIRNSWGPRWGAQGHAWLTDSYLVPRLISATTLLPHP